MRNLMVRVAVFLLVMSLVPLVANPSWDAAVVTLVLLVVGGVVVRLSDQRPEAP